MNTAARINYMAKDGDIRCGTCPVRYTRKALWKYNERYFCNSCFDAWAARNDFDPTQVERLSNDQRDFERMSLRVHMSCRQ